MSLASIPGIVDVEIVRGPAAATDEIDLVVEIPHGATQTRDYDDLAAKLTSPLPESLVDFFHVNTDAGAPELGLAIARLLVEADPRRSVCILRCRIPRTFIDCNRRIDASPEDFKAGKVSPGLMPWIATPEDRALLRGLQAGYVEAVGAAVGRLAPGGALLMLHTYAPRTVDVEVDANIVTNLHAAYQPDKEPTWPLRPELDVIGKTIEGESLAPAAVVEALKAQVAPMAVGDSATYPMHPSTQAYHLVMAHPGRALCLEVRRDLLADPFEPFAQMRIAPDKVARLATPIATSLRRFW